METAASPPVQASAAAATGGGEGGASAAAAAGNSLTGLDISPNYSYVFEEDFDQEEVRGKVEEYWVPVCFYASVLYLIVIFGGQYWMAGRPRFEMRRILFAWNSLLAAFSIVGACRTVPEFLHVLTTKGTYHSMCISSFIENDRVSGFWSSLFVLSKVPELGDTIFIVLRKQPLIFLHWYHHMTVLIYAWYSFSEYSAQARWFIVMNYLVHSVMYTYYALRAIRIRVPNSISMVITTMQLVQMVVGCVVNIGVYNLKQDGLECNVSDRNIKLSFLMYTSYFVLFGHFFYDKYIAPKKTNKDKNAGNGTVITDMNGGSKAKSNGKVKNNNLSPDSKEKKKER